MATESEAQAASLPQECQGQAIQSAQTQAGLVYQEWAENKLATKLAFPDGSAPVELCKGSAYNTVQSATDSGLILTTGSMQGWANLYVVEPNGKVTSLVRNARAVSADFVPDTKYIVVSVAPIGKTGKEFYL